MLKSKGKNKSAELFVARWLVRCMVMWPSCRSVGLLRLHAVGEIKFFVFFFFFSPEKNVDALAVWLPLRDGIRVSHSRQRRVHFREKESRA
jgi:hypothetical protein